jgi:hypothetical protein
LDRGSNLAGRQTLPLTPLEAWYVLQGYCVEPIGGFTTEQLLEMPGHIEGGGKGPGGWLVLWSA